MLQTHETLEKGVGGGGAAAGASGGRTVFIFFIHHIGILLGWGLLVAVAAYEDRIKDFFQEVLK